MANGLAQLWRLLPVQARRGLLSLCALSILSALLELATFAGLARFLALVARPGPDVIRWAAAFAAAAVLAAALRWWLGIRTLSLTAFVAHRLGVECQQRLLHQPLSFHASFNSARALALLDKVQILSGSVFQSVAVLGQSALVGTALLVALFVATPGVALFIGAAIALVYAVAARLSWGRIETVQEVLGDDFDRRTQAIQENFAGIRDIILDQWQDRRTAAFAGPDQRIQHALASIQSLALAPRLVVEGIGMALFGGLIAVLASRGLEGLIPAIGLTAYAALRLLPIGNNLYHAWQGWTANRSVIADVRAVLDLPIPEAHSSPPLPFKKDVALEGVAFAYPGGAAVLEGVSLRLKRGRRLGISGRTGCGKSTLADVLMGLMVPDGGALRVDGKALGPADRAAWQENIAHVGQQLFLLDASIADNVTFGDPAADRDDVVEALRLACLDEFADRLDEHVGERGVRLSGGQRQRLGLARAFYRRRPIVVLDEATNALDPETEARVLGNFSSEQTMLVIGHRPSALATCDRLMELVDGRLVERPVKGTSD